MAYQAELKTLAKEAGLALDSASVSVTGLCYDSRNVKKGDLFFAMKGVHADGHRFIGQAAEQGAAAAVVEDLVDSPIPLLKTPSLNETMAKIARSFYKNPSSRIPVIGITGTNGKTTTTYLIEDVLTSLGRRCGVMGTVDYRFNGKSVSAPNTTPMAADVHAFLAEVADGGGDAVAMEVSSHALSLHRVSGVDFKVGVFTNLTQDHLDFHKTMDGYFDAKAKLFRDRPTLKAVINADDVYGQKLLKEFPEAISTSVDGQGSLLATETVCSLDGLQFTLRFPSGHLAFIKTNLLGRHNIANCLSAAGALLALGLTEEQIVAGLSREHAIPGRLERVEAGQDFVVVVDYAHTHDALEKVLTALKDTGPKKLICVFGAGGDRDRTKRPKMGRVATTLADWTVVTSDNPRSEKPSAIIKDIEAGIREAGNVNFSVEVDREKAIASALKRAGPGDIVLIAGKGHETYQIIGNEKIHFSDLETAREMLTR